jgi:ribosomal protein S18 acetylase RimI-like enzyme
MESDRKELADGCSRAYFYSFRVRSPYQGVGIGTLLMQTAESDLRNRGYNRITLNVRRDNSDARRLYERFGYIVVADEPGRWSYLDHNGHRRHVHEPSWRMEKDLFPVSSG